MKLLIFVIFILTISRTTFSQNQTDALLCRNKLNVLLIPGFNENQTYTIDDLSSAFAEMCTMSDAELSEIEKQNSSSYVIGLKYKLIAEIWSGNKNNAEWRKKFNETRETFRKGGFLNTSFIQESNNSIAGEEKIQLKTKNMTNNKPIEELQVDKLQNEIEIQNIDKKLKERELKKKTILQPTVVTLLVAVIGLIGAAITNYIQRNNQLKIEEKKFQYSIYQKALEAKDNITAARILDFYIKAGLLPGEERKYTKLLENGNVNEVPTYSGIYENIVVPRVDNSGELSLSNNFIKGKGTEYLLSYNAHERLNSEELNTIVIHCSYSSDMKKLAKYLSDTVSGRASAHILIDKDGKIIQQVPFNYMSFHAAKYNKSSIGIELINLGLIKKTDTGYVTVYNQEVDAGNVECNNSGVCWEKYSDEQINTAYEVCKLIARNYGITQIVGHSEINSVKQDPGPFFPMDKFKLIIKEQH